jgi:hypothetical protein
VLGGVQHPRRSGGDNTPAGVEHAVVHPQQVDSTEDGSTSRESLRTLEHTSSQDLGACERARQERSAPPERGETIEITRCRRSRTPTLVMCYCSHLDPAEASQGA